MTKDKRQDYGNGSLFFDEKRGVWIASVDYRDPSDGRRRFRRKSAKPNARGNAPKELRDWMDDQRWRRREGDRIDPKSATVKEWFETWLSIHKPNIKSKTRESYDHIIQKRIIPGIGAVKLMALDGTIIQEFINRQAKAYSPRGAQYTKTLLKMGLKDAVMLGYLKSNPAEYTKAPRQIKKALITPTSEMIMTMLDAAKETMFGVYFLVLAASGARRGEILALTWDDVNFKNNTIDINRTMVYTKENGIEYNDPKTTSGNRSIILPVDVMKNLKTHHGAQRKLKRKNKEIWKENKLVFSVQDGGPQNPDNIENAFRRIMKRAGLGETIEKESADGEKVEIFRPAFRIHDLRHAQATLLMLSGENPAAVSKRMGHHSVAFTMSVYTHASQKIDKEIAHKLAGVYVRKSKQAENTEPKEKKAKTPKK